VRLAAGAGKTIAQAYAMVAARTTHCVIPATLAEAIDVAGGVLMADVFFAVP